MRQRQDELVSVIVPVYNAAPYLKRCIESICNQTYKILEILLVDDGSVDESGSICDYYAEKDHRIHVIHKENEGQAVARNIALKFSKGKYIGFVDSDDWIEPKMYENLHDAIEGHDFSMCGRFNVSEEDGSKSKFFCTKHAFEMNKNEILSRFFTYDMVDSSGWDKLFRREILEGLEFPRGYICEDLPFIYYALKRCNSGVHVGIPLYNYLVRKGSTSHSSFTQKTKGLMVYPKQIRDDIRKERPELARQAEYCYRKNLFFYLKIYHDSDTREASDFKLGFKDVLYEGYSQREKSLMLLFKMHLYRIAKKILKH